MKCSFVDKTVEVVVLLFKYKEIILGKYGPTWAYDVCYDYLEFWLNEY